MSAVRRMRLSKLHGLGNDFLVYVVDPEAPLERPADVARRVCDRHRGVGADGLLLATRGSDDTHWQMRLHNADGSIGEMSGNGIRCFAHAVVRATNQTLPTTLDIATDAGVRRVEVHADPGDINAVTASVEMGAARPGPATPTTALPSARIVHRMATVDVGNPHLVLLVDEPGAVDLATEGPAWASHFPGGINVHFVASADPAHLDLAVWERGAGITQACGTGAIAAAHAAAQWGIVEDNVAVQMPGGTVQVTLGDPIILSGPSVWIGDMEVPG